MLIENGANIKGANKGMSCLGLKGAKNQGAKIRVQTRMMDFRVQNIRVQKIRVQTVVGYLGSKYVLGFRVLRCKKFGCKQGVQAIRVQKIRVQIDDL